MAIKPTFQTTIRRAITQKTEEFRETFLVSNFLFFPSNIPLTFRFIRWWVVEYQVGALMFSVDYNCVLYCSRVKAVTVFIRCNTQRGKQCREYIVSTSFRYYISFLIKCLFYSIYFAWNNQPLSFFFQNDSLRLGGPGIEPRWGEIFCAPPDRTRGPTQPPVL